jgi:hypothetical protein
MWDTCGRPVQMRDYRLSSHSANLVAFFWSFLAFITVSGRRAPLAGLWRAACGAPHAALPAQCRPDSIPSRASDRLCV